MPTVIIEETVNDFDTWKTAYDANADKRTGMGVQTGRVYRSTSDGNNVCIVLDVDTVEHAQNLTTNPDLRQMMKDAGVVGAPNIMVVGSTPVATH